MESLARLLEEAAERLQAGDDLVALRCVRIARARLDQGPVNRASRLLYNEIDTWFDPKVVRVEIIVQLLAQEGLLRDERDSDADGETVDTD